MNELLKRLLKSNGYWDKADDELGGGAGGDSDGASGSKDDDAKSKGDEGNKGSKADDKGGKPSDGEAKLLKEVMEKKTALKNATDELSRVKEELKKFEGIDVDSVKKLLKEKEESERKKLEAKGEWDKLKEQMARQHSDAIKEKEAALNASIEENRGLQMQIAELTVGNAFGTSKFVVEELALTPAKARVVYGSHFEYKDGEVVGYDKPVGAKDRTPLVDASGDPLGFDAAIRKIVETDPDADHLLRSKLKPGAGSSTSPNSRSPSNAGAMLLHGRDRIAAALAKAVK